MNFLSSLASFIAHELDSVPVDADRDQLRAKIESDVIGHVVQRANEVPDQSTRNTLLLLADAAKVISVRKATKRAAKKKSAK